MFVFVNPSIDNLRKNSSSMVATGERGSAIRVRQEVRSQFEMPVQMKFVATGSEVDFFFKERDN